MRTTRFAHSINGSSHRDLLFVVHSRSNRVGEPEVNGHEPRRGHPKMVPEPREVCARAHLEMRNRVIAHPIRTNRLSRGPELWSRRDGTGRMTSGSEQTCEESA